VNNLTIDIADVKLFVEEPVQNYQEISKAHFDDAVDETSKYITISDLYANTNQILEEYRAIKTIELYSNDNHEVLWRLARVHMRLADASKAIDEKNVNTIAAATYAWRAINISQTVNTLKWWGITAAELGKIEGHSQYIAGSKILFDNLSRAIELEPKNTELLYLLGRLHFDWASGELFWSSKRQGAYENAKNLFTMAVKLEPDNVLYRLWLAQTLMKLNDKKDADFSYLSAVEIGVKTNAEIDLLNDLSTNLKKK
jgi:Tfp pilus assembly protein PilF